MKIRPGFVSGVVLCVLMFCSGCLRHRISIEGGYRVDGKLDIPMLVPAGTGSIDSAKFQTVTVALPAGSPGPKNQLPRDCFIQGPAFSIHPKSSAGQGFWVIRSPSPSGWQTLGNIDMDAQWNLFLRDLARMRDRGCFPSGLAVQSIRHAIATAIPLPANDVPIYIYSVQGERYVDLAPGMEIGIQKVLPSVRPANSTGPLRMLTAVYDVVSRPDGGVRLRRSRDRDGSQSPSRGSQDRQLFTLDRQFAPTPLLRLFLQGFSDKEPESGAILAGAIQPAQLDVLTDLIRSRNPVTCASLPGSVCIDLAAGSVSLLSTVWINGRRTTCPFGTSLASLLNLLPPSQQAEALESVRVLRRLQWNPGRCTHALSSTKNLLARIRPGRCSSDSAPGGERYAGIEIAHTAEGARQLLLLPGDRIDWKN